MEGFESYPEILEAIGEYRTQSGGITFRCPLPERHKHGDRTPSARLLISDDGDCVGMCLGCGAKRPEMAKALGVPVQMWLNPNKREGASRVSTPTPKAVAEYVYRNKAGQVVAVKTRFVPGYGGKAKSFAWSRPLPQDYRQHFGIAEGVKAVIDGHHALDGGYFVGAKWGDGWHFRETTKGTPNAILVEDCETVPLYHANELAKLKDGATVVLVEGEKDADMLRMLCINATTTPNGAIAWRECYSECLKRFAMVVIPDNDPPGMIAVAAAMGSLMIAGCPSLRILLPGRQGYDPEPGGDITDWLKFHYSKALREKQYTTLRNKIVGMCRELPRYSRMQQERAMV